MGTMRWATVVLTVALVTAAAAGGQDTPMPLTRFAGEIELDGMPDEETWRQAPTLPLTMYYPTFRGAPGERTEIRVGYDDRFFYAAGWFYDSDPHGIRVNSLYRDRWNGDDAFAIYVDAFNDNQNAKWFGVTPSATRFDILVSDDGATLNESWDAFWDAETVIDDRGWFVEVRIPLSTRPAVPLPPAVRRSGHRHGRRRSGPGGISDPLRAEWGGS
jgi:hypothetical protein